MENANKIEANALVSEKDNITSQIVDITKRLEKREKLVEYNHGDTPVTVPHPCISD